ncbi:hypothetical protein C6501_19410 [Candidatus Poribacteria bacterium]|nr:MAG: hypothetical protein C6501_19410 [Candidatus Poribacteria bacterium]
MNKLKRVINVLLVVTCIPCGLMLYGCGAQSLGPQEPLLPTIDGESKFSDRFSLEEAPLFFYDLFGRELLEGHEVHQYVEEKEFNEYGELILGWTGQLDTGRYALQLDHTILTEDAYRGRYNEFVIGDHLRIKPATLFPNRYIIFKTEFDGFRWDISFAQERHLFTLLNSRISNPVLIADVDPTGLQTTIGKRNGFVEDAGVRHIENTRLVGFRGQGLLGDIFRVGFTYVNLHKEHPERIENPFMGTVANTPPESITVVFRDDSPEDNHVALITDFDGYNPDLHGENIQGGVGAAFKAMVIKIVTQGFEEPLADLEPGEEPTLQPAQSQQIEIDVGQIAPVDPAVDQVRDSVDGEWKIVDGFSKMKYDLVFAEHDIDPRTVKSVDFEMIVAGDYNIAVIGFSEANMAESDPEIQEWIKTVDGHIQIPYRDIIEAPGNYGQSPDYTDNRETLVDNPSAWEGEGRPRKVTYRYGAARAAVLYGLDLEGTVGNVFVRAHYSINGKYKQYPTIPKNKSGFSRINTEVNEEPTGITIDPATKLPVDSNGIPTYSETEGERFEALLGGDGTDEDGNGELGRETAWFVQLKSRFGKLYLEGVLFHIDPGYTTTYLNAGAYQLERDQFYPLTPIGSLVGALSPPVPPGIWDGFNYALIEDDDDDDDWPDDIDFDGVLPRADDRDQNNILDYQEDFLIFEADPPIFTDLIDLNNNGVIDSLEDDFEPQYEYGIDREGYHLKVEYDLLDNLSVQVGWLNENEISSRRKNDSKYLHVTYQRDIPDFGTVLFQNRFVRVRDDIPDYSITLLVGDFDPIQITDELDYYNARVNTTTLQFLYTAVPNLTLEAKLLVVLQKQLELDAEEAVFLDVEFDEAADLFEPDERVDFMVPEEQVRISGERRESPFYPDHGINALDPTDTGLIYDADNWKARRYPERNIRSQMTILKARYEIPLGDLPVIRRIGEDFTLTPMVKYIWDRAFDRSAEEIGDVLNPRFYEPDDPEPREYLRFNRRSREDVLGVRLDYQFTPSMNILGGFQYRKFTNRDKNFENYLKIFQNTDPDVSVPPIYRPNIRTRIFEIQAISQGEWLGFNIVILTGYRRHTFLLQHTTSNTTFVRAMMGF